MKIRSIVHPLLFSIYPILFYYNYNKDQVPFRDSIIPLLISLSVSALLFLIARAVFRNSTTAGLIVSLALLLFFSYGHVYNALNGLPFQFRYGRVLLPLWACICIGGTAGVLHLSSGIQKKLTSIAAFVASLLLLFSLSTILPYEITAIKHRADLNTGSTESPQQRIHLHRPSPPRDIYYIILDRYTSAPVFHRYFDFENKDFLGFLHSNGFYIADHSRSNYIGTYLSLASSLNMRYLNTLCERMGKSATDKTPVYSLLQHNRVVRALTSIGYTYIHFGSWWQPTRTNPHADKNIHRQYRLFSVPLDEFSMKFLRTTLLFPFLVKFAPLDFEIIHRNSALYQFDNLESVVDIPGPKFVFAHILMPHNPFVFDEKGDMPPAEKRYDENAVRDLYIDQVCYTNKRLTAIISHILSNTSPAPVIILQSDEGVLMYQGGDVRERLHAHLGILNAYYLPQIDTSRLYRSITPVNSFRTVFNHYFGSELPLLRDSSFISVTPGHPYTFTHANKILDTLSHPASHLHPK
jgi:hypothetical protein